MTLKTNQFSLKQLDRFLEQMTNPVLVKNTAASPPEPPGTNIVEQDTNREVVTDKN
jgi:hypothetical protein